MKNLKQEIEKIIVDYIGEVTEDTRRPEMIKQLLTLISKTLDDVIGPDLVVYDKGEPMGVSTQFMDGVNQLKKEQRARKKELFK